MIVRAAVLVVGEEDDRVAPERAVADRAHDLGDERLAALDREAREMPQKALGHLGEKRLRILIGLLERARNLPDE